jgi:hypothetical protein
MEPHKRAVEVVVRYRFVDLYRAAMMAVLRQFRVVLIIFGIVGVMAGLALTYASSRTSIPRDTERSLESIRVLYPRLLAAAALVVFMVPALTAKKTMSLPEVRQGLSYAFSEDGVQVDSVSGHSDLKWVAFRKALETRREFLLISSRGGTYSLPKHCFASDADVTELRQILAAALPDSRLRRF